MALPKNPYIVVLVTTNDKQEAKKLIKHLLDAKLIACANIIGPGESYFNWGGKLQIVEEFLVFMKSRLDLFDSLFETIKSLHSYENPEVIALPIVAGSIAYLNWVAASLE